MIADDPSVDVLVLVVTMAPAAEIRSIAALSAATQTPVAILWTGNALDDPALSPAVLVAQGHAVYRDALPCLKALRGAMRYEEFRRRLARPAPTRPAGIDADAAGRILSGAKGTLSEHQSKALLACYGLPVTKEFLVRDAQQALQTAKALGNPVALKIQSPDIPHKTEAKAIRLDVAGDAEGRRAFDEVMAAARAYKPEARIEGVLVQEMLGEGHEVLVGVSQDPTFGPVLTVGLGGIHVEILKDVAFRLPPVAADEAMEMLQELRAWPLLAGARGRMPADAAALVDCVERISWLAVDLQGQLADLDINPLRVLPQGQGVRVVDALVVAK